MNEKFNLGLIYKKDNGDDDIAEAVAINSAFTIDNNNKMKK